jgi:hypothetical protein
VNKAAIMTPLFSSVRTKCDSDTPRCCGFCFRMNELCSVIEMFAVSFSLEKIGIHQ